MPDFDGELCARVLKKAKDMGKYTVLDTAWDSKGRWMKVLEPCGKFANAVGTHCVMAVGASTGIKKLKDIKEFMEGYNKEELLT